MARQKKRNKFNIDPAHEELNIYGTDAITLDIWTQKYHFGDEEHPFDSMRRVVEGVYAKDENKQAMWDALEAMQKALWIPAGRIQAGAGTPNIVTLLNCYVSQNIHDSMSGIADAIKDAMLTMQQGGGIGMNFSTLRPSGAYLSRTGAVASGPLPFMDMWDSMCETIMSAGSRRGAMMAVMHCEHPDLVRFIKAKQQKGRLTNFNVSVLITDAFMDAVKNDEEWHLGFNAPRADGKHLWVTEEDGGNTWYAYEKWNARALWSLIVENTYEWSEPGVIFIDRINNENNLNYCETITATNPCGEQPLPQNGCCNLGAVNLARMVKNPFSENAVFDFDLLKNVATLAVRFLDNVIDVTYYPLEAQRNEEFDKRRIGVGITGLANALSMLEIKYGSALSVVRTDDIMRTLKEAVYEASANLAKERGAFPLYETRCDNKWGAMSPVVNSLPTKILSKIKRNGIRNGVLLTIAPTGTTSLYAGNVSSGLEPVFLNKMHRRVRMGDDTYKTYTTYDYGYLLYMHLKKVPEAQELPTYMATHADLSVMHHLAMQAVCQKHIDASVSKTINCPKDMELEEFKYVYLKAYETGCKGCTTYRPSDVRGSILSAPDEKSAIRKLAPRPEKLHGTTYKVKWPSVNENYYITINDVDGRPYEVFIQSTSSKYTDWTTALALMISALMRRGDDLSFIPEELEKVISVQDTGHVDGKFYGSLVAIIGATIGKHLSNGDISSVNMSAKDTKLDPRITITIQEQPIGEICTRCNMPAVVHEEGCDLCKNCGATSCY